MFLVWVFRLVGCVLLLFVCVWTVVDQLPRLGKRELICLLLFTCNCVFFVWGGGGFPLPLGAWDGLRYFIVALPEPSI